MRRAPPRCERRCGTFPPDPLPSDSGNGLCAVRRADLAAGPSAYAEDRGLCRHCCAQCAARRGAGQEEGGVRRPHLRHRRVVRGERVVAILCPLARRSPAPIRADSVRGPSGVDARGAALPVVVRDGLVGAADEQRHGGFGGAVDRRKVQRCGPAGRRRRSRSAADRPPPDGPPGKAHPTMYLVFTSARAPTSFPTIA